MPQRRGRKPSGAGRQFELLSCHLQHVAPWGEKRTVQIRGFADPVQEGEKGVSDFSTSSGVELRTEGVRGRGTGSEVLVGTQQLGDTGGQWGI